MAEEQSFPASALPVDPGEAVFGPDGERLGYVSGVTQDGFEVTIDESHGTTDGSSPDDDLPGKDFGEGYLMWRCGECGEMGPLEVGIPETCPSCGSPKEVLGKVAED